MSFDEGSPVNTLAQLWLWKFEIRVLGTILGCFFAVVLFVVSAIFGEFAVKIVIGATIAVGVLCLARVIKRAIYGRDQAFDRVSAMHAKAMGPDWNKD